MKLIPEQVSYLREEIEKLRKVIQSYGQYYLERDKEAGNNDTCMFVEILLQKIKFQRIIIV